MPRTFKEEDFAEAKPARTFTDADFEVAKPARTFSESDFVDKPAKRPIPTLTLGERLSGPLFTATDIAERIGYGLAHPIKMMETTAETAASQIAGEPRQLLVRPSDLLETPIVKIPSIPQQPTIARQLLAGTANEAINLGNFFLTPEGISTLGIGALPKTAQTQLARAFATQMATDAPQQLSGALEEAKDGNWQGVAQHVAAAGGEAFMAKQLGEAAVKPTIKAPKESNATSSVGPTEEVHGDLQPRQIQGEGQVPTPEGERGILAQASGGIPEVKAKGSEVPLTKKGEPTNEKEKGQEEEALRETVGQQPAPVIPDAERWPGAKPEAIQLARNTPLADLETQASEAKTASGAALESARKRARATGNPELLNTPKIQELSQRHQSLEEAVKIAKDLQAEAATPKAKASPEPFTPAIAEGEQPATVQAKSGAMALGIAPPGTEAFERLFEWTKNLPAKLAGKSAPVTSRASEQSGNALVRFASSKIAAPQVAKSMATQVLGENPTPEFSKKLGAVLVEDRLRSIPNAQAGTIIGKDYSPFSTEAEYQAALSDPETQAAIERHKQTVQPEAEQMHEATGGELAGPGLQTGAFVNLKAIMPGAEEFFGGTSRGNLENPLKRKTRFGKEAKGTAQEYELDYRTLAERMIRGNFEEFSKRQLYDQLVQDGLAQVLPSGSAAPTIGGKPAVKFTIERRGGKVENLWIRRDLAQEFRNAENVEGPISSSALINAANLLNQIQLKGPTDAVWHVANMLGSIAGSQGGKNVLIDLARKITGVDLADAIGRITASGIKVMRDSPEIQAQLAEIAQIGAGRAAHGGGIGSRAIALVDKAGRLVRDDMYKNLVARGKVTANEATRREWINQLGNYNPRLMGQFQRFFKEAGFSPFIVAGRNFNRMAARRLTLDPGIKAANPAAYWQMKGVEAMGIVSTLIVVPSLINYAITGNPNGRPGTKVGQIDTGKDSDDGKHIVIDPAQWTGLRRGLRISGIGSVVEGVRKGETSDKIAKKAITDVLGGVVHPWAGPAINAASIAFTGYGPTKFKESENPNDYGANVTAALKQLNSVAESLISAHEKDKGKVESFIMPLAGAIGVKEVFPTTARQRVGNMVQQWMKASGDPKLVKEYQRSLTQDFGASDYSPLRDALRANNQTKAKAEIEKLTESKSRKQIGQAMKEALSHPFTGSRVKEGKFLQTLSAEDRALYDKAKEERQAEYRKFLEVWRK